jgi:O-methyltransferase
MSAPTEVDKTVWGQAASVLLESQRREDATSIWCHSSLNEVKGNMALTGYPGDKLVFVKGKVEDTLKGNLPGRLALLRLDTDWYESTKIELQLLYPLLNPGGLLIIDDFGHWEGAKKAVLEYFGQMERSPFLHRIDYTGRLLVK